MPSYYQPSHVTSYTHVYTYACMYIHVCTYINQCSKTLLYTYGLSMLFCFKIGYHNAFKNDDSLIHLSFYPSIHASIHLSIDSSIRPSIFPRALPSVYLEYICICIYIYVNRTGLYISTHCIMLTLALNRIANRGLRM